MKFLYGILHINNFCILILLIISGNSFFAKSQNVVNNGNNIYINKGANLVISGSYYNIASNFSDGKIEIHGNMFVRDRWINNAGNNVFVGIETIPDGNVILDGSAVQHIQGLNPTLFENLIITNADKILDNTDNGVKGVITIDAVLNLNRNKFIIDNSRPSSINYKSKYILSETTPSEGYGEVQWNIGDTLAEYQIPFGTGTTNNNDLNLSLTTTSAGQPSDGSISYATYPSQCDNLPLPSNVNPVKPQPEPQFIADRYWIIDPYYSVIKPNINIEFTYTPVDINAACNPGLDYKLLKGQSYCKDCGDDWQTVGQSFAGIGKVFVEGVLGKECYAPWRLMSEGLEPSIFFPNAFTPDNDNLNDEFMPVGFRLDMYKDYKLMIFDRWGDFIFQSTNIFKGWDGTVKGSVRIAPEDVYVWVAEYIDTKGLFIRKYGRVTLLITRNREQ